jgi:orotidine-5'-phosphate decarboxylase
MNSEQLFQQIRHKKSFLCIGLDTDYEKLPAHLKHTANPLFDFNKQIIDHTHDLVIAYKPNTAFYECHGAKGWEQFKMTVDYIKASYPGILIIADAKRCDIGNSAARYADAFFGKLNCDGITVSPYMGRDSAVPFLHYPDKWLILLALTSNPDAADFQLITNENHERLFESVLKKSKQWGNPDNMMYVVGATQANMLGKVREIVPEHFLLIPGIGAQGGDLNEVAAYGLNRRCGLIVNVSRSVLYASSDKGFASSARLKAEALQQNMEDILRKIT